MDQGEEEDDDVWSEDEDESTTDSTPVSASSVALVTPVPPPRPAPPVRGPRATALYDYQANTAEVQGNLMGARGEYFLWKENR